MTRHLHVLISDELLAALDGYAKEHGLNRSQAARLAIHRLAADREFYAPPHLPNWRTEAWAMLLHGLFGDERLALTAEIKPLLEKAIAKLDERSVQALRLRFGLDGPCYTLKEVAELTGVTRERVRQVEAQALRQMRYWLQKSGIWKLLGPQLDEDD